MRRLIFFFCTIGTLLLTTGVTHAAGLEPDWRDHLTLMVSERLRGEVVDWFRPRANADANAHRYSFLGSQLRAGARITFPHVQFVFEMQDTRLVNLPDDASLPPPVGNLGPGATYFAHTRDRDQGEPFLKQGYLTFRQSGLTATAGRFEYGDGLETIPADPTLAWLKRARIGERLIGPFGYTHVQRSFDGLRLVYDRALWNATLFASHPTHGGFEVSANRELDDISLAGLTFTLKHLPGAPPVDLRLFYFFYDDERDDPVKVDNRPRPARVADTDSLALHTWGAHAITVIAAGPGAFDLLFWAALQSGDWGALDHGAWAHAVEVGYQWSRVPWTPWIRIGYNRTSGDDDPADRDHTTFFQLLPTSRPYAQFPFFNMMNNEDLFAQMILKPHPRVTLRADGHWLRLTEARDLWYAGGGATNDDVFGFSGIPSGRQRELAYLVDLGITVNVHERITAYAYYGHAFGQGVVKNTFAGADANYGYIELTFRY